MRIECDSCGAKYQIADEKVAGKLFKVRCKKCSNMILVDGTTVGGQDDEATRVFDVNSGGEPADEAVWYVVIDGAQTGPLSPSEVRVQFDAGTIDAETFAWREGMDDWVRMADVPELAGLLGLKQALADNPNIERFPTAGLEAVAGPEEMRQEAQASAPFAAQTSSSSSSSSFFDAPEPAPQEPAKAVAAAAAAAPAPAAEAPAAAAPASAAMASAASSEPAHHDDKMVGQRNESSVLFSLSDLTGEKKKADDDLPRTEGSGLIDIRVLAQAQSSVSPDEAAGADALGGGGGGSASGPRLAVNPVIPLPTRRSNTGLYVGIGLGAVVIVGLLVAIIFVLMREDPAQAPMDVAAAGETATPPAQEPAAAPVEEAAEPDPATEPEQVAATPDAGDEADVAADAVDDAVVEGDAAAPGADATPEQVAAATPQQTERTQQEPERTEPAARAEREERQEREERETPPSTESSGRDTDTPRGEDAVNEALNLIAGRQTGGSDGNGDADEEEDEPEPTSALPETLSRNEVQSTIRRYGSRISGCREADTPDSASYRVTFTIQPNGGVSGVSAEDSDSVAQCLAGVVSGMTFPRFSGAPIPVTFPFRL